MATSRNDAATSGVAERSQEDVKAAEEGLEQRSTEDSRQRAEVFVAEALAPLSQSILEADDPTTMPVAGISPVATKYPDMVVSLPAMSSCTHTVVHGPSGVPFGPRATGPIWTPTPCSTIRTYAHSSPSDGTIGVGSSVGLLQGCDVGGIPVGSWGVYTTSGAAGFGFTQGFGPDTGADWLEVSTVAFAEMHGYPPFLPVALYPGDRHTGVAGVVAVQGFIRLIVTWTADGLDTSRVVAEKFIGASARAGYPAGFYSIDTAPQSVRLATRFHIGNGAGQLSVRVEAETQSFVEGQLGAPGRGFAQVEYRSVQERIGLPRLGYVLWNGPAPIHVPLVVVTRSCVVS